LFDLYCIGGSSVDLVLKVPSVPVSDQKLIAEFSGVYSGGLVANTACAAAALGLTVGWHGQVGDDDFGRQFLRDFDHFGVQHDTTQVIRNQMTDLCIILVEPAGERTILVVPTNEEPPNLPASVMQALAQCGIVYSLPWAAEWFKPIAEIVRSNQGKIAIDLEASSPVQGEALNEILSLADMVFCSQGGMDLITKGADIKSGIRHLFNLGVQTVITTHGSQGAAVHTPDATYSTPAFNNIDLVDTTGAGDCFHAAYIAALHDDASLSDAIQFAAAAAALAIQHLGARNGLPNRTMVNNFLAHHTLKQQRGMGN
jgi:sugar/nucleoside kinase (ribokinase family)